VGRQLDLIPGERVVLSDNPHWWFFWKHVAAGLGVVVLAALGLAADGTLGTVIGWIAGLAFVVWLAVAAYALASWRSTQFVVTDRRVAYQSGLLRRRGVSIPLDNVNNVNFEQSFIARLLGNGIVTIESAGETGDSVFENIPDPDDVRNTIFEQMEAATVATSQRQADAIADTLGRPAPPAPGAGAEQRLRELESLRSQGLLSETEYADSRRRILDEL
jgi:uncharacterized membrane protein YdbT with pleckstrin-like domain